MVGLNLLDFVRAVQGQDKDEFIDNSGTMWSLISDGTEFALLAETKAGKKHRVTQSAMEVCAPPPGFKRKQDILDSVEEQLKEGVLVLDGLRDKLINIFNNVSLCKGKE